MGRYGVWCGDDLLVRITAPDSDAADVAALVAVDAAITGADPPAALRTGPGDVNDDDEIEVVVEVCLLDASGRPGAPPGCRAGCW